MYRQKTGTGFYWLGIGFLGFFLISCVYEPVVKTPGVRFSDAAVISVQSQGVAFKKGTTFAWLPAAIKYYPDKRLQEVPVKSMLEKEIMANLRAKGMKIVPSTGQAQYSIAYTAALTSSLDDKSIIRQFGLLPGNARIPDDDRSIEKGSLIVYVFDHKTRSMVWRSAAQVGVKFNTPSAQRKKRIQQVMAEIFMTFPLAAKK